MVDGPRYQDAQVEITSVVVGPLDNNVFVVRDRATGESVLVDAADEPAQLLELARRLHVQRVLTTHGHRDHIRAVPAMRDAGYPVGVAAADAERLPAHDFLLEDGQVLAVGELRLRAVHTPGHTPGSMCFLVEGSPVLLSGDTLFPGGPGRTDLPGGDFSAVIESIRDRLFGPLPDDIAVLPGHGAETTIGA
ncbi:MAG TPA: MBL fold metallo-hydrolase, partial [Acidimicrobiales bacterium]|nr:MBL fold metallo-hydrolase [Acidimicrobiales bacterium]